MRLVADQHNIEHHHGVVDQIFDAASRHFAEKGLDGARIGDIAQDARVNKATIYYHIGNKQACYKKVLTEPLRFTFETVKRKVEFADDVDDKLRAYIDAFAETMDGRYRYFPALMMNELNCGAVNLPDDGLKYIHDTTAILHDILEKGKVLGRYRDVNSFTVHMLIVGSLSVYSSGEPLRRRLSEFVGDNAACLVATPMSDIAAQISEIVLYSVKKN